MIEVLSNILYILAYLAVGAIVGGIILGIGIIIEERRPNSWLAKKIPEISAYAIVLWPVALAVLIIIACLAFYAFLFLGTCFLAFRFFSFIIYLGEKLEIF